MGTECEPSDDFMILQSDQIDDLGGRIFQVAPPTLSLHPHVQEVEDRIRDDTPVPGLPSFDLAMRYLSGIRRRGHANLDFHRATFSDNADGPTFSGYSVVS